MNVVRTENKNSLGARGTMLGSFNRSTFSQTKHQGPSNPHPPPPVPESVYGRDLQPIRYPGTGKLSGFAEAMKRVAGTTGADSISVITALVTTCGRDYDISVWIKIFSAALGPLAGRKSVKF